MAKTDFDGQDDRAREKNKQEVFSQYDPIKKYDNPTFAKSFHVPILPLYGRLLMKFFFKRIVSMYHNFFYSVSIMLK